MHTCSILRLASASENAIRRGLVLWLDAVFFAALRGLRVPSLPFPIRFEHQDREEPQRAEDSVGADHVRPSNSPG